MASLAIRSATAFRRRFVSRSGPDGTLTDEHEEPIAADARPQGDGKDIARLKLVAGLLGLGLDEIVRRAERARRRRLRNWVAALGLLTLTFAGLAVWAEINRQEADRQRNNAVTSLNAATQTSNDLIYDLALRFRHQAGVPSALVRDILARAQKLQAELMASGQTSPDLQHSQASVLSETALTLLGIGDSAGAFAAADRARQILEALLTRSPQDAALQLDLGVVHQRLGSALANSGKTDDAIASFERVRALHQALVDADASNNKARQNLATDYSGLGDLLLTLGKVDEALAAFRTNVDIMQVLVQRNDRNADWWRDLGIAYERVGGVLAQQRKFGEALSFFQQRLKIAQMLADDDPANTQSQRNLSVALNKIGDMQLALRKPDEALDAYRKGLALREKLMTGDPENAVWLRDVAISNNLIATVLAVQGKIDDALTAYGQGIDIERKLVARDGSNVVWQSDLFVSDIRIGRLLMTRGQLDQAFKSFGDALAIVAVQIKARPDDPMWKSYFGTGIRQMGTLAYSLTLAREFADRFAGGRPGYPTGTRPDLALRQSRSCVDVPRSRRGSAGDLPPVSRPQERAGQQILGAGQPRGFRAASQSRPHESLDGRDREAVRERRVKGATSRPARAFRRRSCDRCRATSISQKCRFYAFKRGVLPGCVVIPAAPPRV